MPFALIAIFKANPPLNLGPFAPLVATGESPMVEAFVDSGVLSVKEASLKPLFTPALDKIKDIKTLSCEIF